MVLKDIMSADVRVVDPSTTIREAARLMHEGDLGALPVNEQGKLVGIVTDRDLAVRAIAQGRDPDTATVKEVMTPHVDSCYEDQTLEEVAQIMGEKKVRRLPVLNGNHELVGIVSLGDIALHTWQQDRVSDAMSHIVESA